MLLGVCAHGCVSDDAAEPDEFREAPTDDGFGTRTLVRTDQSYDTKKMVAVLDTETNLGGMCYQVTWQVRNLSSAGNVSFHTFCSADSALEY